MPMVNEVTGVRAGLRPQMRWSGGPRSLPTDIVQRDIDGGLCCGIARRERVDGRQDFLQLKRIGNRREIRRGLFKKSRRCLLVYLPDKAASTPRRDR